MEDLPPPRLLITKMRMENFKSYYGVQEVGPFHHCFSSVVGPNGSGKSNVIDAMIFVFGARAKQIRQGKLKDLIHNSEKHTKLPFCKVSVFFQDIQDLPNGEYRVIPGTEIVVSRDVTSDNKSNYYVNDAKKTFNEVGDLLRKRGIDLDHNRFLILQGEVEQISMMKPKAPSEHEDGMLEYLEDIIGSNTFKEDISNAEKKVEELNEARNEKLNRVKIVEKEKDALEGGKREAEAYLEKENELSIKNSQLFQCYIHECQANVSILTEKKEEVEKRLEQAKTEESAGLAKIQENEKGYDKKRKEYKKLQEAAEKAKADFTEFERKDVKYQEDLKHAKAERKKLEKALATAKKSLSEESAKTGSSDKDIEKIEKEIRTLEEEKVKQEALLDKMNEELKGERQELQVQLEAKQTELLPLSKARSEAQSNVDITRSELELLTSNARNIKSQREEAENSLTAAKTAIAEKEREKKELGERQKAATKELSEAERKLQQLGESEGPLALKVKETRSKVEEAKSSTQQAQASNKVLDALTAQSKAGKIKGFHGRLGDLGTIDDKYDCAVTTACPQLNNLVVDTVEQAQQCVEFLRKHEVGRATFIVLKEIAHLAERAAKPLQLPEGSARLYDLIRVKSDVYKVAFYYALRDTLVADNLEQATRIAYEGKQTRFRVVTLGGQLIDTSGTMSGGGRSVAKGGMSSTFAAETMSPQEIATLERKLEEDVQALNTFRETRKTLETTAAALRKELAHLEVQLKRCDVDLDALKQQVQDLPAIIADIKKREASISVDMSKQKDLEAELAKREKVHMKAADAAGVVEAEIAAIEKAIADVGGVRLKSLKAKVEGINEQTTTLQSSITKIKVDAKTAQRKVTQLEKKIGELEEDIKKTEETIATTTAEFADIEKGAKEVMEAYNKVNTLLEERTAEIQAIDKEHNALKESVSKLSHVKLDLEHQLEEVDRVLKDNQSKEKSWQKRLASLKLHTLSRYDEEEEEEEEGVKEGNTAAAAAATAAAAVQDGTEPPAAKKAAHANSLPKLSAEDIAKVNKDDLQYEISVLEEQLGQMKPNMSAIKEYYKREEEYLTRVADLDAITEERDKVRARYEDLRKQRLDTFMAGFSVITMKLKEMYQMITLGGDAELELVDRLNPFSEGIVFSVRPPNKSWKNISNLSGGEKTLSSLALVFALHHYKPTPLYVMDEIDAALDFKNVSIVANYIKERTKNAQFIIISLRNNMFELADRLIGIYKTDDCTKSVTINPAEVAAAAVAASEADSADILMSNSASNSAVAAI